MLKERFGSLGIFMKFDSVDSLAQEGFRGFMRIADLCQSRSEVPKTKGIYLVLNLGAHPHFVPIGGNRFRGGEHRVTIEDLESKWVEGTVVIYIGQAGGIVGDRRSSKTLRTRVSQYIRYGLNGKAPHKGGKYIWHIANPDELIICWKEYPDDSDDPKRIEQEMIQAFKSVYGRLPYANLTA
jgi:hypothetical protein